MAMLILLVLLIFFAALGVPLAFAIGASCVSYILDLRTQLYRHAAPTRMERRLQRADDRHAAVYAGR